MRTFVGHIVKAKGTSNRRCGSLTFSSQVNGSYDQRTYDRKLSAATRRPRPCPVPTAGPIQYPENINRDVSRTFRQIPQRRLFSSALPVGTCTSEHLIAEEAPCCLAPDSVLIKVVGFSFHG